ncbi:hypothetical protein HK102_005001 [Quaeritorhiza haematococci]|nr:hypothetical protein HK102_005001 [Quaeritorhiza haematococci]
MFRATVHECDKTLRMHHDTTSSENNTAESSSTSQAEPKTPLPSEFHLLYGQALSSLGSLTALKQSKSKPKSKRNKKKAAGAAGADKKQNLTPKDYFDAAIERLSIGLENVKDEQEKQADADSRSTYRLHAALGDVLIRKASYIVTDADVTDDDDQVKALDDLRVEASKHFDRASTILDTLKSSQESEVESAVLDMARSMQRHADLLIDFEWSTRERWISWAQTKFKKVLEGNPSSIDALVGLGTCSLSLAMYFIERADEDDEDDDEDDDTEEREDDKKEFNPQVTLGRESALAHLEEALKHFRAAKELEEKDNKFASTSLLCFYISLTSVLPIFPLPSLPPINTLFQYGEALINMGNLMELDDSADDTKDETAYYKEAVACFRRVLETDAEALPEHFLEFVMDWEKDMMEE